jgi:hypothetical protein
MLTGLAGPPDGVYRRPEPGVRQPLSQVQLLGCPRAGPAESPADHSDIPGSWRETGLALEDGGERWVAGGCGVFGQRPLSGELGGAVWR